MYAEAVFQLPFASKGDKALVDVGRYIRVDMQIEFRDAYLVDKAVNLSFQLVGEENARPDLSRSIASGAGFFDIDVHGWAHTLARDLHEPELAQRKDILFS